MGRQKGFTRRIRKETRMIGEVVVRFWKRQGKWYFGYDWKNKRGKQEVRS